MGEMEEEKKESEGKRLKSQAGLTSNIKEWQLVLKSWKNISLKTSKFLFFPKVFMKRNKNHK